MELEAPRSPLLPRALSFNNAAVAVEAERPCMERAAGDCKEAGAWKRQTISSSLQTLPSPAAPTTKSKAPIAEMIRSLITPARASHSQRRRVTFAEVAQFVSPGSPKLSSRSTVGTGSAKLTQSFQDNRSITVVQPTASPGKNGSQTLLKSRQHQGIKRSHRHMRYGLWLFLALSQFRMRPARGMPPVLSWSHKEPSSTAAPKGVWTRGIALDTLESSLQSTLQPPLQLRLQSTLQSTLQSALKREHIASALIVIAALIS